MAFFLLAALGVVSPRAGDVFFPRLGNPAVRGATRSGAWLARRFYARAAGFAVNSFHVEHLLRNSGLLPAGAAVVVAPCAVPAAFVRHRGDAQRPDRRLLARADGGAAASAQGAGGSRPRAGAAAGGATASGWFTRWSGWGRKRTAGRSKRPAGRAAVRCEFLGALDDAALARVYASATVYAQASRTLPQSVEGFGITFLEASFHGCPVAAFRSGGVDEAVRDGETGLLVPEGDLPALAAAVGRLLGDPALRARMGRAGRVFARGFSWEESARKLFDAASPVGPDDAAGPRVVR